MTRRRTVRERKILNGTKRRRSIFVRGLGKRAGRRKNKGVGK